MSLRCSYSSQFQNGLLSPAAFRQIEQALKSAIDHANDSTSEAVEQLIAKVSDSRVQLDDFKFEWGWLEYEGFLELPWWLTSLQEAVEPKRMRWKLFSVFFGYFARKWTRHEHARRLEIMLAVARAQITRIHLGAVRSWRAIEVSAELARCMKSTLLLTHASH